MIRVAFLLTCFNRSEHTRRAVQSIMAQATPPGVEVHVVVADASTDGRTALALRDAGERIIRIPIASDVYWNRGMAVAWKHAARDDYDFYVWLNDDTHLEPNALEILLGAHSQTSGRAIIVGSTVDPASGVLTYGGVTHASKAWRVRFRLVPPSSDVLRACTTMNGNCVLVPRDVFELVGSLDEGFTHSGGDYDYGLRALQLGCSVWVSPGTVGTCSRNPASGTWQDTTLPLSKRWALVRHPKGLPFSDWFRFTRRHGGPLWPLAFLSPYARLIVSSFRRSRT